MPAEKTPGEHLILKLPENLALRLKQAAERTQQTMAEKALEVLNRNLPHLDDGKKKIPYA
jgi:hypothetical protein